MSDLEREVDRERLRELNREMAGHRRQVLHTCQNPRCSTSFWGIKTASFCSNRCRAAATYQRKKER